MKKIDYIKIKKDKYAITEDGKVWSYSINNFMKTSIDKDGYETVSLLNSTGGYSHFGIHRLLMIAFKPCENMEELTVNHIDGNKKNNNLNNLEWLTSQENTHHAWITHINNNIGQFHHNAKITEDIAKDLIELGKINTPYKIIHIKYPQVSKNMYYAIKHNRTWKYLPR